MATHADATTAADTAESAEQVAGSVGASPHALSPIKEQQDTSDIASTDDKEDVKDASDTSKDDSKDDPKDDPEDDPKDDAQDSVTHDVVVSFHVDSDATIQVVSADVITKFKVSAHSVALASPIWRTILHGKDGRTQPVEGDCVVDIDANPQALDTLFRIVHYQFNKVPAELSLDELYELTLLTSRFKCTNLIYPWGRKWITHFTTYVCEDDHFQHCHKVVWIAWELGDAKLFHDMVDALIVSSKVNASGDLVNVLGNPLKEMILPPGILDLVSATRTSTIDKILTAVNAPIAALTLGEREPGTKYCKVGKSETECEAMLLGSAIPALIKSGLFPVPSATSFSKSIVQLKETLHSIRFITYVGTDWMPHQGHEHCNLRFRESAQRCVEEMPVALEDHHIQHLQSQSTLSGITTHLGSPQSRIRMFKNGGNIMKETFVNRREKLARQSSRAARSSPSSPSPPKSNGKNSNGETASASADATS